MTRTRRELRDAVRRHADQAPDGHFDLRLFVSGLTPRSASAVARVRAVCDEFLPGRHDLHVVDLYQQPEFAKLEHVVAAPTLVRRHPLPLRRLIGDMSDEERLLTGLQLLPQT
jgi:circadian clock protein KaiB